MISTLRTAVHLRSLPTIAGRLGVGIVVICTAHLSGPLLGQNTFPASGNVGIGTTSPSFNLHTRGIAAADQGNNVAVLLGQSAAASAAGTTYGGIWYDATSNALRIEALSGNVAWRNVVLNGYGSANVGIGTTNPTNTLSVQGQIAFMSGSAGSQPAVVSG